MENIKKIGPDKDKKESEILEGSKEKSLEEKGKEKPGRPEKREEWSMRDYVLEKVDLYSQLNKVYKEIDLLNKQEKDLTEKTWEERRKIGDEIIEKMRAKSKERDQNKIREIEKEIEELRKRDSDLSEKMEKTKKEFDEARKGPQEILQKIKDQISTLNKEIIDRIIDKEKLQSTLDIEKFKKEGINSLQNVFKKEQLLELLKIGDFPGSAEEGNMEREIEKMLASYVAEQVANQIVQKDKKLEVVKSKIEDYISRGIEHYFGKIDYIKDVGGDEKIKEIEEKSKKIKDEKYVANKLLEELNKNKEFIKKKGFLAPGESFIPIEKRENEVLFPHLRIFRDIELMKSLENKIEYNLGEIDRLKKIKANLEKEKSGLKGIFNKVFKPSKSENYEKEIRAIDEDIARLEKENEDLKKQIDYLKEDDNAIKEIINKIVPQVEKEFGIKIDFKERGFLGDENKYVDVYEVIHELESILLEKSKAELGYNEKRSLEGYNYHKSKIEECNSGIKKTLEEAMRR